VKGGDLDPAGVPLAVGWAPGEKVFFCGLVDDLRLYATDLEFRTLEGIADDGIPWIRDWARARTGFQGGFQLDPYDVVVTAGGEDALSGALDSSLEAVLLEARGPQHVVFRSMAWEGDTVYEQPRLLNFGSWRDQLSKVGAGVLLARFGAVEALEGRKAMDRFEKAYDRLLGEFSESTRRIVVVTPVPFEKPPGSMPDLSPRNDDLRLFVAVMKRLAEKRQLAFVDLFGATWSGPLTRDGIHLTDAGHAAVAQEIARQLGLKPRSPSAELLAALRKKNREWLHYWRPTNWAFLNGDRVEQPSSRDHVDRRIRWFPVEVEERFALVRREDAAIEALLEAKR
jgi:hypothetical protein